MALLDEFKKFFALKGETLTKEEIAEVVADGIFKGDADPNTNPGFPVNPQWYGATAGETYQYFLDQNGQPINVPKDVTVGDAKKYVVSPRLVWNEVYWKLKYELIDEPDLSGDYTPLVEFTPIKEAVINHNIMTDILGYSNFDHTNTFSTAGNLYFNVGKVSSINGILSSVTIKVNSAGQQQVVHLRKDENNNYNNIGKYMFSVPNADVFIYNTEHLGIEVLTDDLFGIVSLSSGSRVRNVSNDSYNARTYVPVGDGVFTIPESEVLTPGGSLSGFGGCFDFTVTSDYENNIEKVQAETKKITNELTPLKPMPSLIGVSNLNRTIGSRRGTTSTTSNFNAAYILPTKEALSLRTGLLKKVSFTTTAAGSVSLVKLSKFENNLWIETGKYTFSAKIGENDIDVEGLKIKTKVDDTFAIQSSTVPFRYSNSSPGYNFFAIHINEEGKYSFQSGNFPHNYPAPNNIAMDFSITIIDDPIDNRIIQNERSIELIKNQQHLQRNTNGTLLHSNTFDVLSNKWINNGWNIVNGGISPMANGLANFLMLDKQYSLDQRKARVLVRFAPDSRFMFHTRNKETNATQCTLSEVDVAAGQLRIYRQYNSGGTLPAISVSTPISINPNRDYIVELILNKNSFSNKLVVTDTITGERTELEDTSKLSGRQHDCYAFCNYSGGAPIVRSFAVSTPINIGEFIIVLGDSLSEAMGNGVAVVNGWAQALVDAVGGKGAVSGRGSGNIDGVQERLENEISILRPKYVVIMIGTNSGNNLTKLRLLINTVKSYGCIPVLNNIPMRVGVDSSYAQRNADIMHIRDEFGISGARMDVATAINNDPEQGADPAKFYPDGVHVIDFGNPVMFNRINIDAVDLLYS